MFLFYDLKINSKVTGISNKRLIDAEAMLVSVMCWMGARALKTGKIRGHILIVRKETIHS